MIQYKKRQPFLQRNAVFFGLALNKVSKYIQYDDTN